MTKKLEPKVSGKIIRQLDDYFLKYVIKPPPYWRRRSSPEALSHAQRLTVLKAMTQAYLPNNTWEKTHFFAKAENLHLRLETKGQTAKGAYITDLTWPSRFLPFWQDAHLTEELIHLAVDKKATLIEKFYRARENLTCHARFFQKDPHKPRQTIICFHGYGGGHFSIEQWSFSVEHILEHFDVMLMVLPHHSYRKEKGRRYYPPRFPSSDPRFTIESLRQVYFDYQGIKDYLLSRDIPRIGLAGISLGGYCTALIAGLDPDHAFFIPIVPMGAMGDMVAKQARFSGTAAEQIHERKVFENLFSPVAPTSYKIALGAKMTILAGESDGVTGVDQARLLADHFGAEIRFFEGGHLIRKGFLKAWQEIVQNYAAMP